MFTGIVDDVGVIDGVEGTATGLELRIRSRYDDVAVGESIAVNGACLTVREAANGWFTVSAISTTLGRTAIGGWHAGRRVNLERAMRLSDRLGGHLVQGHVDSVGHVRRVERVGDSLLIDIAVDDAVNALIVQHGSVAVDGVSLTVNERPTPGVVQVAIVEYTERHTTLGDLLPGDEVHVEADVIGKYVQRLLNPGE